MRKKLVLTTLLIFILAITGCSESTIDKVETESNNASNATPAKEEEATPPPEPKEPEIRFLTGDTVKFDDLEITLNGVRTSKGDQYFKPKNAKFLLVELTIENKGDKAANISTLLSMSLYDADSFKSDIAIFTDSKGSLDGEIAAGRKLRGEVAFDVHDSAYYEFVYGDVFTSGQAIWKFEVE